MPNKFGIQDISPASLGRDAFVMFLVIVLIFFIMREFWCWYFKFTESVKTLKSIESKLDLLNENLTQIFLKQKE